MMTGGGESATGSGGATIVVGDGVSLIGVGDRTGVTGFCRTAAAMSRKSCSQAGPVGSWVSRGVFVAARGRGAEAEWGRGGITGSGVDGRRGASGGGGKTVGVEEGIYPPPDAGRDLSLVLRFLSTTGTPISGSSSP